MKQIFFSLIASIAVLQSAAFAQVAPREDSGYPVAWTSDASPSDADFRTLSQVRNDRDKMENYVAANPNSPWAPSIRNALATQYRQSGRNSLALQHWGAAWQQLKDSTNVFAREEANHALAGQLELLSSLGRIDTIRDLLVSAEGRQVSEGNDRRRIEQAQEAYLIMVKHPSLSYRCGSLALANVARFEGKPQPTITALIEEPSTTNGISLARLVALNQQFNLGLVAVKRTDNSRIPIPSVVHWAQNHYGAVLEYRAEIDSYKIVDPTFRKSQWISASDLDAEASGYLLVPENQRPSNWPVVSSDESTAVFGRGYPYNINDANDRGCKTPPTNPRRKCVACGGMPVWWVSEPYISLWLADEPVFYTTSRGEQISFRLTVSQRGSITNQFAYGTPGMMHNWYSKIYIQGMGTNVVSSNGFSDWTATVYLPNGGERTYSKSVMTDAESKTELQPTCGVLTDGETFPLPGMPLKYPNSTLYYPPFPGTNLPPVNNWYDASSGFRIFYPDGSVDTYGFVYWRTNLTAGIYDAEALLTSRTDPLGNITTLSYQCYSNCSNPDTIQYQLSGVTDYDGNVMRFYYYSAQPSLLYQVKSPYGPTATFSYDTNGNLTNIVDAASLTNSLVWDNQGRVTNLITGYGTTTFLYYTNNTVGDGNIGGDNIIERAVTIIDANGGTNLFAFRFDCSGFMAPEFTNTVIPQYTPVGTLDTGTTNANSTYAAVSFRNSFHWDPRQCATLSTMNLTSLTATDYLKARMQHWLGDSNNMYVVDSVSVEQEPSPDGIHAGQLTFYDYASKTTNYLLGADDQVAVVARLQPSGNTEYTWSRYNSSGYLTNFVSTYMLGDWTPRTRTNIYVYATNTIYYSSLTLNPYGYPGAPVDCGAPSPPAATPPYFGISNPLYIEDDGAYHVNYTNTAQFSCVNLLVAVTNADGSSVHYGGYQVNNVASSYSCTYTQNLNHIFTPPIPTLVTNEAGYVTTLIYDANNRLISLHSPAGLTTSNQYNSSGFLTNTTDIEIGRTNSFTYTNGLVYVHQDELGRSTTNFWDGLQRLTGTADSAGTISNVYQFLDLAAAKDRLGHWSYYGYDPLRNMVAATNANGEVTLAQYCQCGSLEFMRDAITNYTYYSYDLAGRLINVLYPDGYSVSNTYNAIDQLIVTSDSMGSATNTYNLQGLTAIVADTAGTLISKSYDIMDRPISVTDAQAVTTTLAYDSLGRVLTNAVSGQYTNTFTYSTNGLVTSTDALSHLTRYLNDQAGRLVARTNANLETNFFQYNAAGQKTNIVDGNGHHTYFQYDQFGRLTNKINNASTSILQLTYDANGRVLTNWTPATGARTFLYDQVGRVRTNLYPSDPQVVFTYDANGRLTNLVDAAGTTVLTYTQTGQLASENGPWNSNTVTITYTNRLRSSLTLQQPGGLAWTQFYTNDAAKRLTAINNALGTFNYFYDPTRTSLVTGIGLPNASFITNQYDALARLTNTALVNYWGHTLDGYSYGYNVVGWRTNLTRNLGITTNSVVIGYDNIGQLTSWLAQEFSGSPRANEQLGYGYDTADNLYLRTNSALVQTFTVDALNQLSNIVRSGNLTLAGNTPVPAPATNITVNGNLALTNGDFTFAVTNLPLANGINIFTNIATNVYGVSATNILTVNLPMTVTCQYDSDGDLTNDGTRSFVYNGENRLTNVYVPGLWQSEFVYDGMGRRRIERDFAWQSGQWVETNETRYIYDGMLVIQERDTNNNPQVTYTRGLDLGGSRRGRGGIGGLLARVDLNGTTFYHADGSGNVTALINTNQNIVARYEYDPFGKLIGKWGTLADANRYRFSSKEAHSLSGLYSYGFRFYDPNFQRWLNHDPIAEEGGLNLYGFVRNSPLNVYDPFGLDAEDDDLDRRLQIAATGSAFFADYAYDNDARKQLKRTICEGNQAIKRFAIKTAELPIAPILAVRNGLQTAFDPSKDPLERWGGACTAFGNAILAFVPFLSEESAIVSGAEADTIIVDEEVVAADTSTAAPTASIATADAAAATEANAIAADANALAADARAAAESEIPTIGGRSPINSGYAGDVHPSGVEFTDQGFPDFSPHSVAEVELDGLTGNYAKDAAMANRAVGLESTPQGYVWHHVEDARTMQLVPQTIHNAARHTGGAAVIRNGGFDQ